MKTNERRNQSSRDDSTEEGFPLSGKIPMRWILLSILAYMLIHNIILWLNT